jgi:dienelactone hydrolase
MEKSGSHESYGRAASLSAAFLLCALALRAQATAPEATLPLGQVVERVACLSDPTQTYALFLPSKYRADRLWPILYAFDPAARGPVPTRLFSQAAERLGYVVVASNNSRNGPWPPMAAAIEAVWQDTHARFALDPERVYATGMSGGTGPAALLGTAQGAGVIACAGPIGAGDVTGADGRFTWIGIAGDADFNFDWTKNLVETLVARGVVARFAIFDGGHGWPPEDLAARALSWLELGAMRSGRRVRDADFIAAQIEQGRARVRNLVAQGQLDAAADENATLARELAGLAPVDAFDAEARRLRATPEAVKARKREKARTEKDRQQSAQLLALRSRLDGTSAGQARPSDPPRELSELLDRSDEAAAAREELDRLIGRLARDVDSSDPETRLLARRVLNGFYVGTLETGRNRRNARDFSAACVDFELCAKMRPQIAWPIYELARSHAARGDRKKALAELRKAIALGFADAAGLVGDGEWKALASQPEFTAIVEELRARR